MEASARLIRITAAVATAATNGESRRSWRRRPRALGILRGQLERRRLQLPDADGGGGGRGGEPGLERERPLARQRLVDQEAEAVHVDRVRLGPLAAEDLGRQVGQRAELAGRGQGL